MTENDSLRERTFTWTDPLATFAEGRQLSGLDYLHALLRGELPKPPISEALDFTLASIEKGRAVFECVPQEFHYNPIGIVHGGLAATLLDSALGCAVQTMLPAGISYATVELHVNLVRAITRETGLLLAEAEVLHFGRQMATAQGRLIDANGKLYAHGSTTCMIVTAG
ncbi:MAG: PaaI family thioesterase [Anaerolineae bacterium]|nr:PaaI family thioesterase [Anaerolineae bacterium]